MLIASLVVLRNCQTLLQSSCAILRSHQQCVSGPASLTLYQYLVVSTFILAISTAIIISVICFSDGLSEYPLRRHVSLCLLPIFYLNGLLFYS